MKKVLFLISIVFILCFTNNVSAKTIGSVSCKYDIYNPHNTTEGYQDEYKLTQMYMIIQDYSDETAETVEILYMQEGDGTWHKLTYENNLAVLDWKYTGSADYYYEGTISFFPAMIKKNRLKNIKVFYDSYKSTGTCPVLYSNMDSGNNLIIETYVLDPVNSLSNSIKLNPIEELLREPGSDVWKTKSDFFKSDDGNTTLKEDLICTYDMEFDMYNIKTPVEFRTIYNPGDGSKTYRVSVGATGYNYDNLNEDVFLMLGQGGADLVYISAEQLKKIFLEDKCLERTKIYHYYDMSYQRYTITTDGQEAADNGAGGRYDNGDGSNDGQGGSSQKPGGGVNITNPDMDILGGSATCAELLGPNLMKIVAFAISTLRIVGSIIAIVLGMMKLIPAVTKGDQSELNSAIKTCIIMAAILIIIVVLPILLKTIGNLFGLDTTCIP